MKSITKLVLENLNEAYELIKARGGRIDFVPNISDDNWDGNPNEYSLPWVVVGYDEGLIDTAVLAVRCCGDDNGKIEFLAFDCESYECYGWISYAECCSNTDNEVYVFIEEYLKSKDK